ncbi:MAG: caspase family protein [Cyanobacteria bacterium]|nr:caspase family protein [Cyanobacteriota bacterium]
MPSRALIIGIDDYPPASGQERLESAAKDARRIAAWLSQQGWAQHVSLLCAPHIPERGERPATRAEIGDALLQLEVAGRQAGPDDRLYLFYAGHGIGYFDNQLLLLPQDTRAGAYGESAIPWPKLELWLGTTGFRTQLCFLDTCRHEDEQLFEKIVSARLPFDRSRAAPADVAQYVLYATGYGKRAFEMNDAGVFTQVLLEGLEGAADATVDYDAGERVVHFEALRAYLEREVPKRTNHRQRCVAGGQIPSNPIVARLGPAGQGELRVDVRPPAAAHSSTVEIYRDSPLTTVATRTGPPFRFDLLQDELYRIVAHAPGYVEHYGYSRVRPSPHIVQLWLQRPGEGTLSGRDAALVELSIEPCDPHLPVHLYNGGGQPVDLPARSRGGYRLQVPPDRYRAVMATPEGNFEREFELRADQTELVVPMSFDRPQNPLDRLLDSLDRGESLRMDLNPGQAGLLVLAEGIQPTVEAVDPRELQSATPPSGIAELVHGSYVGRPGVAQLRLVADDGQPCQLLLPLLAGRMTIVGIDRTGYRHPSIELLLAPNPLRRRHHASQKRIIWAQRFFKTEGRTHVVSLLDGLDDEPLALALAGYAALGNQDASQAGKYAGLLRTNAPDLDDGYILFAATERMLGRSFVDPVARPRVPVMLAGLQSQVSAEGDSLAVPSLALELFSRAVFSQIWLLIQGNGDIAEPR